jgi:hypothetical protein
MKYSHMLHKSAISLHDVIVISKRQVCSKIHMLVFSAGFSRRVAEWSIYNTFMFTADANPKGAFFRSPTL